jgi:hypothetical protein
MKKKNLILEQELSSSDGKDNYNAGINKATVLHPKAFIYSQQCGYRYISAHVFPLTLPNCPQDFCGYLNDCISLWNI